MVNNQSLTVGLLWHSVNSDNLGVGALTASHIAIIEHVAHQLGLSVRFVVLGWRDPEPAYIERPDLDVLAMRARDLLKPSGLYAAVRQCDLVLDISGGDSFADIYGARRFLFNVVSKMVVLAARRPLLLSPQTIGPFQRRWARLMAGAVMRCARKVVTRDNLTTEFLRPFNLGAKVVEATDVAFRLPYDPPPGRAADPVRIGINPSGLLFNGGYTRDNMFALAADYPELVRAVIGHFSAMPGLEMHLIGHVNSERLEVEDDYRVAQQLAAEFPGTIVAPLFAGPSEAKSYIATMDFFCGSRMHACIAAFSSGVPVLPIAYSRKFAGVFGAIGYAPIADCTTQSAPEILGKVIEAFERRAELKAMVEQGQANAERKLGNYEDVLRSCFAATTKDRQ